MTTAASYVRRWLILGAAALVLALLVCLIVVAGPLEALDTRVSAWAVDASRGQAPLAGAMRAVTVLGDWQVRLVIVAAFLIYLLTRGYARAASYVLYTTLGCWMLVAWVLKPLFGRARPDVAGELVGIGTSSSLPSAHAANAAAIATAMALVAGVIWWRRRRAITVVAVAAAAAVGVSRVWLGVHWPSDVVAGWLVGLGAALLMAALIRPVVPAGSLGDATEPAGGVIGSALQRLRRRK